MSGAGNSYTIPQSAKFDCGTGIINTNVTSIDLDVLSKHTVGTILQVELSARNIVILVDGDGEVLGSVVNINISELIKCIEQGNVYQATITKINNPTCVVKIERE